MNRPESRASAPLLSALARKKKVEFFFDDVPQESRILEIGCGDGWLGDHLRSNGWSGYTGLDLVPPADVIGDIRDWVNLGLGPGTFDIIVAFEVVEHVPCYEEMSRLLKTGGRLFLTSPKPQMDWLCKILEAIGLSQKRSSPHTFLVDFRKIPLFVPLQIKRVGLVSQWGKFVKL